MELRRLLASVNQTKMRLGESFSSKEISVQPNKANYIALYTLLVIVGGVWRELVSNRKVKNTIVLFKKIQQLIDDDIDRLTEMGRTIEEEVVEVLAMALNSLSLFWRFSYWLLSEPVAEFYIYLGNGKEDPFYSIKFS